MPGTTRYSATFDRTYEEDDRVDSSPPPNARRSRSQSWQANSGLDGGRPYTPLGGRTPNQRSSSTDNGPSDIPTRVVAKTVVKPHTNPFQFVKVGTCPLYKKAEEQLKKVKEVKQPEVLKEEEEEWQTNLDSWKSRRRKMSEDVFRRQEEIKQFEIEEQIAQVSQKKTKTFSEMVESRATRGRALSLCLISTPMELQDWEFGNSSHKNGSCSTFSGESEENSTVNSEDEGVSLKGMLDKSQNDTLSHRTNGNSHIENNSSDSQNGDYSKLSEISVNSLQMKPKEGSYIDSGLESISSHRTGDTPDSGSDFSHDGGSSIDCDSPRTGVNLLEEFSSKSSQMAAGQEVSIKLCLNEKGQDFGFTFLGGKDEGQVIIASVLEGSKADSSCLHLGDQIISVDGAEISSKKHSDICSIIQRGKEKGEISLLLWRHTKCTDNGTSNGFVANGKQSNDTIKTEGPTSKTNSQQYEKSIESENEMYVDDFEELQRQSELVTPSSKSEPYSQGVYALNVSTPPSQNCKDGFSVNSLFPLSPVTELPSPEDAKTMASTLASNLMSVSNTNTISKELANGSVSSNIKENNMPFTNVAGTDDRKNVVSSKKESKVDSAVPSFPVTPKSTKLCDSSATPQEPKPKLVLRRVKTKPKQDTEQAVHTIESDKSNADTSKVLENEPTVGKKSVLLSSPTITDNKEKSSIESRESEKPEVPSSPLNMKLSDCPASPQEQKPKLVLRKVKTKPKKVIEDISSIKDTEQAVNAVEIDKSNTDTSKVMEKEPTVGNKSAILSSPAITDNKEKSTVESLQNEKPKLILKKVVKTKQKKGDAAGNASPSSSPQVLKEAPSTVSTSADSSQSLTNNLTKESTKINSSEKKTTDLECTKTKSLDNKSTTLETSAVSERSSPENKPSTTAKATVSNPSANASVKAANGNVTAASISSLSNAVVTKPPVVAQTDTSKPSFVQRKTASKNANSQKVNTSSAKQIEESTTPNCLDSLNVVFQSQPKNVNLENQSNVKTSEISSSLKTPVDVVPDIPPVEKVAEEMEKLILEQLEEEERAKELASVFKTKSPLTSPEHMLTAPPKLAEPPKEKPPPPPPASEGNQKDTSLKRVNSTKRIKKEIHKRRSNFLGIDSAEESLVGNESSIQPPPALEEILKAEMELDRQGRLQIESASTERLTLEEKEIMQKEREIIETLESEERRKHLINGTGDFYEIEPSNENDVEVEEHIQFLKNEQKRLELERINEEQQLRLMEETQLREREEFIRKQEADKSAAPLSDSSSLSVTTKVPNTLLPSLSADTQSKVSISGAIGDGESLTSISGLENSKIKPSEMVEKVVQKPAVPPKPLKKKEAIRKERERLRQEQEALQREREEHRQKLMQEQEELLKHQQSHAPDVPVPRLGPLPPLVQPSFSPPLTATPNARDSASYPSRSHHGVSNGPVGSLNAAELMGPAAVRQNKTPPARKPVQNEAWGQQKVTSVRKQNQDSLTENRYNQNHWLIQEAEMRRIAELKDRQRISQLSCSQTHLAEDDVCSNAPRVPVIPSSHNQHLNYAVQDKMWNYNNQPGVAPVKKYPPPVVKDQLHTIYPRETVSQQPPMKPSRVVPMERQEQMLSVSGRKRCSHCNEELGRGAAMIIESLQLYYHIQCFQCCVCQAQLGNGSCGTDVRVRNQKLHCHNCYSNDEAGLKFSQV